MTTSKPRTPRVYLVTTPDATPDRLVRALSPQGAIKHVTVTDYSASVATQDQLIAALAAGIVVEDTGAEPDEEETL